MNAIPPTEDADQTAELAAELAAQSDPILDSIFSALGVDGGYLENDAAGGGTSVDNSTIDNSAINNCAINTNVNSLVEPASEAAKTKSEELPWILHVDDDTELSNALKMRLKPYGVTVFQAFHGIEGVRSAFSQPADVIILDYQMPNGNGDYVLKRLKQYPLTQNIPIIILTGRRDQGLENQMLSLGADRFLNKPVRFDVLLEELRRFVPLHEPRGEACLMA